MFQCLLGLYITVFYKYGEETKCHPLTRFALMALAHKNPHVNESKLFCVKQLK